jgi:hypothetical protein
LLNVIFPETENWNVVFNETKRNGTKIFRNGTKINLQGCGTKRNETESLRNGTKRNGKNSNDSQTLQKIQVSDPWCHPCSFSHGMTLPFL